MWQRIQTLYILLSTGLSASLFFTDRAYGLAFTDYLPYTILISIVCLLDIIALTTPKFRVFQFRTMILSSLFAIALQIWLGVEFVAAGNDPKFNVTAVFPAVCFILDILAARGIWADELMVRSASHLRGARRSTRKQ